MLQEARPSEQRLIGLNTATPRRQQEPLIIASPWQSRRLRAESVVLLRPDHETDFEADRVGAAEEAWACLALSKV